MTTSIEKQGRTTPERVEQRHTVTPAVDIFENKDEFLLFADLPGVTKEGLTMHFERGQLFLQGDRRQPPELEGAAGADQKASHDFDYRRVFTLPHGIDSARIEAELNAGVLRVRLPKEDSLKPRRIEVKAG
jgi:HSP20 family molecular chaperone IbpA